MWVIVVIEMETLYDTKGTVVYIDHRDLHSTNPYLRPAKGNNCLLPRAMVQQKNKVAFAPSHGKPFGRNEDIARTTKVAKGRVVKPISIILFGGSLWA